MAIEFTFRNLIQIGADVFFDSSTTLMGLAMMVGIWLIFVVVLANLKAPISYSLVPLIPVSLIFMGFNILSVDVAMIIIIVVSVFSAIMFRGIISRS